jgi:integrase
MKKSQEQVSQKRHKTEYPGVSYRVRNRRDGKGTERVYYVRYKDKTGTPIEVRVGCESDKPAMTASQANKKRSRFMDNRENNAIQRRRVQKWTFLALMDDYIQYHTELDRMTTTQEHYRSHFNLYLKDKIGSLTPSQLTQKRYKELYDELKKCKLHEIKRTREMKEALGAGDMEKARRYQEKIKSETRLISRGTLYNIFQAVKALNNHAVRIHRCPPIPAVISIPKPKNKGIEYLKDDQIDRLEKICAIWSNRNAANIMRLAFYTGARHGAILRLKWRDIDWINGVIALRDGKSRQKGHIDYIPLNTLARDLLRDMLQKTEFNSDGDPVFANKKGEHRKQNAPAMRKLRDAIGLPKNFRPVHGARHSFATVQLQEGTKLEKLMKLLTHKKFDTTLIYAHLQIDDLREDSDRMTARVKRVKGQGVIPLKAVK